MTSTVEVKTLCYACTSKYDDIEAVFRAKDQHPPAVPPDGNLLACPLWPDRRLEVAARLWFCDDCGAPIAVARSSDWLLSMGGRL